MRYLLGHVAPEKKAARQAASRAGWKAARFKPPPGWRTPTGWCGCGCGERTPVAKITRRDRDQYQGYPLRYLSGHNSRGVVGPAKNSWRGGRSHHKATGYMRLYAPEHPDRTQDGYVLEHRLVMERLLGRRLLPEETVHHRDGDRANNTPANLELWSNRHPHGQRVRDMLAWARAYVARYGDLPPEVH